MKRPKDLLTLESVRPGQMAKGSFKNSKSKGKTQVFVPIDYIQAFCLEIGQKTQGDKTQNSRQNRSLNFEKLALFACNFLDIFV